MLVAAAPDPLCPFQTAPSMALSSISRILTFKIYLLSLILVKNVCLVPLDKSVCWITSILRMAIRKLGSAEHNPVQNEEHHVETEWFQCGVSKKLGAGVQAVDATTSQLRHDRKTHSWSTITDAERGAAFIDCALSMIRIAPQDDVSLAVAWNLPTIRDPGHLRTLIDEPGFPDLVSYIRKALSASGARMEGRALVFVKALAKFRHSMRFTSKNDTPSLQVFEISGSPFGFAGAQAAATQHPPPLLAL